MQSREHRIVEQGSAVGANVKLGAFDGVIVGLSDGASVGVDEVGDWLGDGVGFEVDGDMVGVLVGNDDVGDNVGAVVGDDMVGESVGKIVGAGVHPRHVNWQRATKSALVSQ